MFLWLSLIISMACIAAAIDWNLVPAAGVTPRNLESGTLGSCTCDIYRAKCDHNCCCDTDCNENDKTLFTACSDQASNKDSRTCYESTDVTNIFRINHLDVSIDAKNPVEDLVCIIRNNYPGLNEYFAVPQSIDIPADVSQDWYVQNSVTNYFKFKDSIELFTVSNAATANALRRFGTLSTVLRSSSGICEGQTSAAFLEDSVVYCRRNVSSVAELCEATKTIFYLAARVPGGASLMSMASLTPMVTTILNASTGDILTIVNSSEIFENYFNGVNAAIPSTTTSSMSGTSCLRTPVRTTFVVSYAILSGGARITSFQQKLYVEDISEASFSRKQAFAFEILFRQTDQEMNVMRRSGNPGYITGSSISTGVLLTNETKTAIEVHETGLSLPVGSCMNGSWHEVQFSHDVLHSHCQIDIHEGEFEQFCSRNVLSQIINRTAKGMNTTDGKRILIAQTGDADWRVPSSWLPISGLDFEQSVSPNYDAISRSCTGIPVGLSYTFVIGRAGSLHNPQDIILGARAVINLGTWSWSSNAESKSRFYFSNSVTWKRNELYSEKLLSRRVIAPSVLPSVDEDIFFPFRRP